MQHKSSVFVRLVMCVLNLSLIFIRICYCVLNQETSICWTRLISAKHKKFRTKVNSFSSKYLPFNEMSVTMGRKTYHATQKRSHEIRNFIRVLVCLSMRKQTHLACFPCEKGRKKFGKVYLYWMVLCFLRNFFTMFFFRPGNQMQIGKPNSSNGPICFFNEYSMCIFPLYKL